jgi:hypothetical protein
LRDNTRCRHRDQAKMKTPFVVVTLALAMAILLAASLLIATGTQGEDALWPLGEHAPGSAMLPQQRGK